MSEQNINKEAFKQAEEALLTERVEVVKGYILKTLRAIDETKKKKEEVEEKLRVLKADLEDLKNGRFEKIEERNRESEFAASVTVSRSLPSTFLKMGGTDWALRTSGTYNTGYRVYYLTK